MGVRNLRVSQPVLSKYQISDLDIRSTSDQQWEGVYFEVMDAEEESLSFLCETFDYHVLP